MNKGNPLGASPSLDNSPGGSMDVATHKEGSQPGQGDPADEVKTIKFTLQELERGWLGCHPSSEGAEIQTAKDAWLAEKEQVEKGLEQRRLRLEIQEQRLLARYNELIDRERSLTDYDEDAIQERRPPPLSETEWRIRTQSPREEIEALQRRVRELEKHLELAISERDTYWDELRQLREDTRAPGKYPDNAVKSSKMPQDLELERKKIQGEMHELRLLYAEVNEMRDIAEREFSRKEAILSRERLRIARLRETLQLDRDQFLGEIRSQNQPKG